MDISKIVNTDLYPIDKDDTEDYTKLIASLRSHFCQDGIVTLPGFLRSETIPDITRELNAKSDKAHVTNTKHNIYLDDGDNDYPQHHIRNKTFNTKVC